MSGNTRRTRARALLLGLSVFASLLVTSLGLADSSQHSHFRYGHYYWSQLGGNQIGFTLQNAWRRDANPCVDPATQVLIACSAGDGLPAPGDVIVEYTGFTQFGTGDATTYGSPLGPLEYLVTSIDPAQNYLFGIAIDPNDLPAVDTTINHTYGAPGDYLAFTDSCCRIGALINNPGAFYRVETIVNVGSSNESPVSTLPPIVNCPINALCSFTVPGFDPNGDTLRFRMGTPAESGASFQPGPPHAPNAASIDPSSGQYTWDTNGATLAGSGDTLYSTQVVIEDLDVTGATKSKVGVDFLIKLVQQVGSPPAFDHPPTPRCGESFEIETGDTLSYTVQASDPDAGDIVTLNVAGAPPGSSHTPPLPTSGNPVSSVFTWTPATGQEGTYVISYSATDTSGQQTLCSFTVHVKAAPRGPETLTLDPKTSTNPVDSQHCVEATVLNASGDPVPGITVRFEATGSVSASGSAVTGPNGVAQFCYTGPAMPGSDVITAYADTDNDGTQAGPDEPGDAAAKDWVVPSSTTGCKITDGGRIKAANGDKATFGANAHSSTPLKGQQEYQDHGPATPMKVKATMLTSVVCSTDGTSASIFGVATIDGAGSYNFRIDVRDLGEPGVLDTYRIRLSNGYDSGDQVLSGGNIQIH